MKKKKVLVLGAAGMAGHVSYLYLKNTNKYDVKPVVYKKKLAEDDIVVDVTCKEQVTELIKEQQPDYIINCVGVLIKGAKEHPENAILINAYFPHLLARLAEDNNAKLIHLSTDCVFSGKKGDYSETDAKDAEDIYGQSKALGEIISDKHLTLRTSIIGPEIKQNGEGLFHWFMKQQGQVNGFTQAFWGGITTLQLAIAIEKAIDNNLTGLMHVTNGEKIAKYDLVKLLKTVWGKKDVEIIAYPGKAVDKSLHKSVSYDFGILSYQNMLLEQKKWMDEHAALYHNMYFS